MHDSTNPPGSLGRAWLFALGTTIALAGMFFIFGGGRLISLGGSWYFLLAGIGLVLSGFLIIRHKPAGASLFILIFALTAVWAVWDAGFEFWPLISRLLALSVASVIVALSVPLLRRATGRGPAYCASFGVAAVLAIAAAGGFLGMFVPHPTVVATGLPTDIPVAADDEQRNWEAYGNTSGGSRFAALDQINRDNVSKLEVAWTYHTGDTPISPGANGAEDQQTPLQVDDTVFLCTPHNNVIALDADTGMEKWKVEINAKSSVWMRCRGLAYFDVTRTIEQPTAPNSTPITSVNVVPGAICERRILMNTITAELIALDADTGVFCPDFGSHGRVDLKVGMGNAPDPRYVLTSAPTLAGTTIVVGGRVADNISVDAPGGVVRGFDVVSGQLRWAFDPGNPAVSLLPAAGASYTRSTPNVWAAMSYDPVLNTVFMPVGNPSVDLWGASRTALDQRYSASMLALDATTGREKWVYQTVHNDLWDFDVPMQPTFIDFPRADGTRVPALVFGTKAGQLFVLDRANGRPLTKVVEQPVKPSTIPNEPYSPTQPRSVGMPQIGAETLTESDMWGVTPFDQLLCRIAFKGMRYDGLYTAPGEDISLSFPGWLGGMNWGGLSSDPVSNYIFANDLRLGLWIQMVAVSPDDGEADAVGENIIAGMGLVPMKGTPYGLQKGHFQSHLRIPCQKPPFGTITAIDMKTQKIAWQVPAGRSKTPGQVHTDWVYRHRSACQHSVALLRRKVVCCSSPAPRTFTYVPWTQRQAMYCGKRVCPLAAKAVQ
jgi:quinate dehydrogenase (quinone)